MSRVLVISPHPDDEAIGCGGVLRKHAEDGDDVHVVFLTSGENGGHGRDPRETSRAREREAAVAAEILGIGEIEFWREPDGSLEAKPDVVERLHAKLTKWQPASVYVSHEHEMHDDHRAAFAIVGAALAKATPDGIDAELLTFEVWTPFQRIDSIVDISPYIDAKLAAIRAYESQCGVLRFDEAFRGLARYRGEMHSWPGGDYAEVFGKPQP